MASRTTINQGVWQLNNASRLHSAIMDQENENRRMCVREVASAVKK